MLDAETFGQELAAMVKAQIAPLLSKMDALEKRLDDLPAPQAGKDADPEAVAAIVRDQIRGDLAELRGAVDAIPTQPVGLTEEQVKGMLDGIEARVIKRAEDAIKEATSISVTVTQDDLSEVRKMVNAIEIPPPPKLPDIPAIVQEAVSEAMSAIPVPKDGEPGKSLTADDVAPLIAQEVVKAVSAIPAAKDGVGLAGALIDRDGNLVVTLTNGEAKTLGPVVGKDAKGIDGKDGLGFEDMSFEEKDGRLYAVFKRGDVVKEARLPGISYRGVWKSGEYLTGDSVTFGACQWIATADTDEKPGEGKAWQLAVRKGRDGKDHEAKPAKAAEPIRVGVAKDGK